MHVIAKLILYKTYSFETTAVTDEKVSERFDQKVL